LRQKAGFQVAATGQFAQLLIQAGQFRHVLAQCTPPAR
jgi:hypothetical protein